MSCARALSLLRPCASELHSALSRLERAPMAVGRSSVSDFGGPKQRSALAALTPTSPRSATTHGAEAVHWNSLTDEHSRYLPSFGKRNSDSTPNRARR